MSTNAPTVSGADARPPLSEPQRLLNTFIAPSKTFSDLNRKPTWWAPWLLMALLSVAFAYLVDRKVGYDQVVDASLKMAAKRAEQLDRLPPDQRQQQLAIATKVTKAIVYCSPIILLVLGIVAAGVLMLTMNFLAGSEISFKVSLAVLFYAWLPPSIVKTLVIFASMMAPGFASEGFNIENPATTNLASLMEFPPTSPALYKLAAAVDVFAIWSIILLGIGFACAGKVKRSTATLIVAGWYAVLTLVSVAWAVLGS
jgi:Yip1 domain